MQPAASILTLITSIALTPLVRALACRLRMVAEPRADRWHSAPTALLGGVAIYGAFVVGFAAFYGPPLAPALPIVLAATCVFAAGLLDDLVGTHPLAKLAFQLGAAAIVVHAGLHLPWTSTPSLDGAITIVWIVGITNAFNLLDNMDGLAAGIAVIACVFLAATFLLNAQPDFAVLPLLLGGAALGFLAFNLRPASVFMGDAGSMFLGSALAGMALLNTWGRSRNLLAVLLTPVLIMTIPILDTSLVTITRRWAGRPVSEGGRDHLSHRLVALGISERQAVLILYALAAVCGTLALAVRWLHKDALLVVIPAFGLATLLFALYLGRVPLQPGRGESRAEARTLPEPLSAGRRAGEILMDVALVCVAYGGAYLLRWGFPLPPDQRAVLGHTIPLVVVLEVGAFLVGGIYRELGRQPRVKDLVTITRSAVGGASCSALVVMLVYGFHGPSRGALVLNGVLLLAVVTASRLCLRLPAAARGLTRSASGPA